MEFLGKKGAERLNKHLFDKMKDCRLCPHVNHTQIYPGVYRTGQKYFFVGAAPWNLAGEEEAFRVSHAAANFEKYIAAAGITRDECFTTNAVVHIPLQRSSKSRQPNEYEISNCSRYLKTYINVLKPKLVIALGGVALEGLRHVSPHPFATLTKNIGSAVEWLPGTWLMCATHPSPMAVSFRGDAQQIEDYKAIKEFYDTLS